MKLAALALAALSLTAGCLTPSAETLVSDAANGRETGPWERVYAFDGQRGPNDATARFPFLVPDGAGQIAATLVWREPSATLAFRLLDAEGEEMATGWQEAPTRAYVTTTHPVTPGTWTLEITSQRAAKADYAATLVVTSDAPPTGPLDITFVVPPRNPTRDLPPQTRALVPPILPRDYAEINLNMVPGDAFQFSWTASAPIYFNVHYHGENGTERPIEERGTSLAGEFTATMTEVYALLWRNEGTTDIDVTLQLDGTYRVHSMTRKA